MGILLQLASASTIINTQAKAACGDACGGGSLTATFTGIANLLVFLVGSVSVIMIIIGGLRYVISNGDQKAIESAKNTILYAVIGIVVAIAAFAIVNFVATHVH
jgi:cytochrome bd-type quinol oxidase subunit 2